VRRTPDPDFVSLAMIGMLAQRPHDLAAFSDVSSRGQGDRHAGVGPGSGIAHRPQFGGLTRVPFVRSIEHWRALPFLSTREAAVVLGVQPREVRELVRAKTIEGRDLCGREVVVVSSLVEFVGEKAKESAGVAAPLDRDERRLVRDMRRALT
jgi:hypothetical protein